MSDTNNIELNLTSPEVLLNTSGTYVDKNIHLSVALEDKTVNATTSLQEIAPSSNYAGLSKVTVNAVQTEAKTVTPSNTEQIVTPSTNKFISKVTVAKAPLTNIATYTPFPDTARLYKLNSGDIGIKYNEQGDYGYAVEIQPVYTYVATSVEMDALLVKENAGKFYVYTGETDSKYTKNDLYQVEAEFTVNIRGNMDSASAVKIYDYNTDGTVTTLSSTSASLVCNTLIMRIEKADTATAVTSIIVSSTTDSIEVFKESATSALVYILNDGDITINCNKA